MKKIIAITGASGLIGSALKLALESDGHKALSLSRHGGNDSHEWWPTTVLNTRQHLEEATHLIHLAGDNIARRSYFFGNS